MSEKSYNPSGSSSSGSDDEEVYIPRKTERNKNSRKLASGSNSQQQQKKQKRSPLKLRNFDDYFENIEQQTAHASSQSQSTLEKQTGVNDTSHQNAIQSSPISHVDIANNSHESTAGISDDSLHSMLNRKLEVISNQLNQYRNDVVVLTKEVMDTKRLIAKVEVLIKCRKESTSSDSDNDFLNTLQSYGLPIATKENLDNLELRLKNDDEKSQLVCLMNLFDKHHFFNVTYIHFSCFISVACFN